jgi:hypothetical protein
VQLQAALEAVHRWHRPSRRGRSRPGGGALEEAP